MSFAENIPDGALPGALAGLVAAGEGLATQAALDMANDELAKLGAGFTVQEAEQAAEIVKLIAKVDGTIQGWTKGLDAAFDGLESLLKTKLPEPEMSCAVGQAAIPVSTAMKAVEYGAARIALRVLPRMALDLLDLYIETFLGKALALALLKAGGKSVPGVGTAAGIIASQKEQLAYNQKILELIIAALGCKPGAVEKQPMRAALAADVLKMKARVEREPRLVKNVTTRNPDGR